MCVQMMIHIFAYNSQRLEQNRQRAFSNLNERRRKKCQGKFYFNSSRANCTMMFGASVCMCAHAYVSTVYAKCIGLWMYCIHEQEYRELYARIISIRPDCVETNGDSCSNLMHWHIQDFYEYTEYTERHTHTHTLTCDASEKPTHQHTDFNARSHTVSPCVLVSGFDMYVRAL